MTPPRMNAPPTNTKSPQEESPEEETTAETTFEEDSKVPPAPDVQPAQIHRQQPTYSKRLILFPHVFLLVVCSLIMLLSFAMRTDGGQHVFLPMMAVPIPGTCMSNEILGMECPGCGMTRCFISLSHGQFGDAWRFNSAGFLLYLLIAVQIPFRLVQIVRIQTGRDELWQGRFSWFMWLVAGALIVQWIVKMVDSYL